jgi:ABC-type polysaccharide/polyol phosphate export permease
MIISLFRHFGLIASFSSTELKRRYAGTLLGPLWAILPSAMTVLAFWFVFEIGLKAPPMGDVPYFFYFTVGIIPWFLFFDVFSNSVNTIESNRHLITKMVFPSEILPVVNVWVASVTHVALTGAMILALLHYNLFSVSTCVWLLYFYLCATVIAVGTSWLASSIAPFSKDFGSAALIAMGLVFWITPIMWQLNSLSPELRAWFEWNPLTFIASGYRYALYNAPPPSAAFHAKFWTVAIIFWIAGGGLFKRLQHHFADVL